MFSKLVASEVIKYLNMDRTEAWIKPSLESPQPRTVPRCYRCTFLACTLYSSWAASSVEGLSSAKHRACCFYNHIWKLHPRWFRNPVKTPFEVLFQSHALALQCGWLFTHCTSHTAGGSWSENRVSWTTAWARSLKCSFSCSRHHLCKPVCPPASDSVFSVTTEGKKMKEWKKCGD